MQPRHMAIYVGSFMAGLSLPLYMNDNSRFLQAAEQSTSTRKIPINTFRTIGNIDLAAQAGK